MIYRVEYYGPQSGSEGSKYFGSMDAARKHCREEYPGVPTGREGTPVEYLIIDQHQTPKTKSGMIRLLERWGSHPDNG